MSWIAQFFTGFLGGATSFLAFSKFVGDWWLGKQRARYEQELEKLKDDLEQQRRRIQAEIDRSVFVTHTHFETEFIALKELFKALADVRLKINSARPAFDISSANETDTQKWERVKEPYRQLSQAYGSLIGIAEMWKPFYTADIYHAAEECVTAATTELMQIRLGGDMIFTQPWYQQATKNFDKFMHGYNATTEKIRERISQLCVVSQQ
jgi:hypothetical protein